MWIAWSGDGGTPYILLQIVKPSKKDPGLTTRGVLEERERNI